MAIVATALTAFTASATGAFLTQTFVGRLLVSVATSALISAIAPKPKQHKQEEIPPPGITSEFSQTGADNPLSFIPGTFATAGTRIAPLMSHGTEGGTPNAYLTLPVAISAVPGMQLARVNLNGDFVTDLHCAGLAVFSGFRHHRTP